MFSKRIAQACLAAAIAITPATRSAADVGDGLVGGLVGGVIGGVIVNESAKHRERKRQKTVVYKRAPSKAWSAQRAQVRETQVALNYFGFPAGTPDGVSGRNTRNAVSQYQVHMNYPATGYLNEYERQFLVSSYHRAQSSGAATAQVIAQRGQGTRGLLLAYRDEAAGVSSTMASHGAGVTANSNTSLAFAATEPAEESVSTGSVLPNLMDTGDGGPSLASHCSRVSLVTNTNGGFVTKANMSDPRFALSEQFCLARTYAIADGEELAGRVNGLSASKMEQQCAGFGPAMKPHLAALSLKPQEAVVADVSSFILESGMSPAQLSGTARICLSVGYRTDDMNVAVGSALLLTALGERGYAELLGHHLNEGFGAAKRPDLALAWYQTGIEAVDRGADPIFVPGNPERTDLIRAAVFPSSGSPSKADELTGGGTVQPASGLPEFSFGE